MNLINNRWIRLSIQKSGKGEKFHWKATYVPHRKSVAEVDWIGTNDCHDLYLAKHRFTIHFLQVFWLWFVIGLELKEEHLSESKMVKYESTHFHEIDINLNKTNQ